MSTVAKHSAFAGQPCLAPSLLSADPECAVHAVVNAVSAVESSRRAMLPQEPPAKGLGKLSGLGMLTV